MDRQRLRRATSIVFLTGAGVSAESGIPTFRGPEGYWTIGSRHYHPQELATRRAFAEMPAEVWSWYLYRRAVCRAAAPNSGHRILAELETMLGDRFLLVTQNVDGLHRRSGNSPGRTYEIHGNIDFFRCWKDCGSELWPLTEDWGDFPRQRRLTGAEEERLRCPRCGARARPHVLWFDECYDEEHFRFESSRRAAARADVLISLGTSGNTNLPLQMGRLAAQTGALLIDINPESNPFADLARGSGGLWLQGSASRGLERIMEGLVGGADEKPLHG